MASSHTDDITERVEWWGPVVPSSSLLGHFRGLLFSAAGIVTINFTVLPQNNLAEH